MMDIVGHSVGHNALRVPIFLTFDHHGEILYTGSHHAKASDIENTRLNYIQHIVLLSVHVFSIGKVRNLKIKMMP